MSHFEKRMAEIRETHPRRPVRPRWVASTAVEGRWMFTASDTPHGAMDALLNAAAYRRVLIYPINNPITAERIR